MTRTPVDPASWTRRRQSRHFLVLLALAFVPLLAGLAASAYAGLSGPRTSLPVLLGLLVSLYVLILQGGVSYQRRRRLERLARSIHALADNPKAPLVLPADPELRAVKLGLDRIRNRFLEERESSDISPQSSASPFPEAPMTRSGLYESPPTIGAGLDPNLSADLSITDEMVCRLDPRSLCPIDASPAAERFLGWPLEKLKVMTFPEIVHPDHRDLAREQLRASTIKGEAHGLIYRIKTAKGATKAIEMNVSARYAPDCTVSHLRCHLADVTAKLQASRELRRRTRELALANEQLRTINRELQELKDRYGDLYQNSPAMYFSLDPEGRLRDCNNTMLRTLGLGRNDLIGRLYTTLLPESLHGDYVERYAQFLREGHIEVPSRWVKPDGSVIDVWITGTAVRAADGQLLYSRSVAQDVTTRRQLEAELSQKNARLASANEELSRKNRELDEFSHVVSHDLQEPLRTLIAFSDFLQQDCGDRLGDDGKEYLRYLVDASRRMRAMIGDLLDLSRG